MLARTLITGGTGFLGRHLVEVLLAQAPESSSAERATVVVASRGAASSPAGAEGGRAPARAFDAAREGACERLLDELEPERILNCAALSSLGACEADPSLARAVNVELPRSLARWSAARGARLVHVSTDLVFGGSPPSASGFDEASPRAPLSLYGRSKAAGEDAVRDGAPSALVVRLPLLFGDSGGRARGASDALLAAVRRGERPTLFTDERRSPLEVRSAAEALAELAESERAGLLHVAGPDRVTRYDLGLLVLCAYGRRASEAAGLVRAATRAQAGVAASRPADCCLDASLARSFLRTSLPPLALALAGLREREHDSA